ncbi:hypothetical protein L484_000121 [Morus notabilis]|nr:hypothetical protein L484_000121 [Morus notabilis]
MVLLWLSQYTGYKAQLQQTTANFQFFLFLFPILLILFMASYSSSWWPNFQLRRVRQEASMQPVAAGSSPWGVAIFVVLLLILLSYQSSFHSKWFGPLRSSD